jgi:hypothetical protein
VKAKRGPWAASDHQSQIGFVYYQYSMRLPLNTDHN